MTDIFISYARVDRTRAEAIARALEAQGWSVWWDRQMRAGVNINEVIDRELGQARCVLVLWSAVSVKRDWVNDEARVGKERGVLIPVLIEDVRQPLGFGSMQYADLVEWDGDIRSAAFEQLRRDIEALIGPPMTAKVEVDTPTKTALSVICEAWRGDRWVRESIMEALEMRSRKVNERRRCIECHGEGIVPHKQGKNGSVAHFEHDPWNEKCPLRDQTWEEERLAAKDLQGDGLSKKEAWSAVKKLRGNAKAKGITFSKLSKRARAAGIDRREFLDRFAKDPDALMAEIESREPRP